MVSTQRITVFGANGGTGEAVVREAVAAGYRVNAAVRRAGSLAFSHELVVESVYSFADPVSVRNAITGSNVVVSAIGKGGLKASMEPTTLYSEAARSITQAMMEEKVRRLFVVSSGGVEFDPESPWFYRKLLRPMLINNYLDMMKMETIIEETDRCLDWTIVRPTYLLDGPSKREVLVRDRAVKGGSFKIHRIDVAKFIVSELSVGQWIHRYPTLSYP